MKSLQELSERLGEICRICYNEPLGEYTSFRTGGPADCLLVPDAVESIPDIVGAVKSAGIALTVIGGGTNLLVGDRGIRGAVLAIRENGSGVGAIAMKEDGMIHADASVKKDRFIQFAIDHGYGGTEFMAGIPGCLGGGIIMNAGTYMGWFADIVKSLDLLTAAGEKMEQKVTPAMSSYRKLLIPEGSIVLGALFKLPRCEDSREVRRRIDEILADRKKKHPLDYPSAGSVFKNPEGHSSWQLIDQSGLKGYAVGGARVSDLHTNFIINAGGATSRDIRDLIEHVRATVDRRFGIRLETEVRMIGEF